MQTEHTDFSHIRALAIDLDGTMLKDDASMGEFTIKTLKTCSERGIQIILTTGRSLQAAEPYYTLLGIHGPMVFYNGAVVADVPAGKVLYATFLDQGIARYCVQVAHQLDVHVQAFTADNRLIYERVREESILYEQRTNLKGEIQNLLDFFSENHPASVIKVMFIAEPERLSEIETELDRAYGTTFYRTRTQTTYLEVLAPGVSKGAGLKLALQFRGLSPASTIAFGDADNDVSLADVAAYFIAPANAIPAVQQRAQLIVPSNEEEGPAHFIAEHVLCDAEHVLHK